jgi:glycosyltransferase involved in cell wall biosynthesis
VESVRDTDFDVVLYQSKANFEDRHDVGVRRSIPAIVLEHDPPRESPTDTRHWAADEDVILVHVTPFNALMWDNGSVPTRVVEHAVYLPPDVRYSGEIARGLVAVNNIATRGRRLGFDVYERIRQEIPLDLVGMGSDAAGGLGEVQPMDFPEFASQYRFFFNPIRYTSLGLAVCEAMSIGVPVVGLATTEMATVIENGVSGFVDTSAEALVPHMRRLLDDPAEARRLGENAREYAAKRFGMERFKSDWEAIFSEAASRRGVAVASGARP